MRRLDVERHRPVRSCTRAFGAFGPSVEARRRYLQHPADQHHRKFGLLCPYESVSHCDSLAKKAVAFFNMSRSIRSCRFSRRSCDIPSRSAVLKTSPPPRPASASLRDTQLRTADSVNPRSRATAAIPFPPSRTRQTTSALYSGVNARLFLVMGHPHRALSPYLRCPLNPGTSGHLLQRFEFLEIVRCFFYDLLKAFVANALLGRICAPQFRDRDTGVAGREWHMAS